MDIESYINNNLDDVLNLVESNFIEEEFHRSLFDNNEDTEDIEFDDIYEKIHEKKNKIQNNNEKKNQEDEEDDGYYFINLINIFTKHYNKKFDKTENFFNNIKEDKQTSNQMELFFDSIFEYNIFKGKYKLENEDALKYYFDYNDKNKIKELFDNKNNIYIYELNNNKLVMPSLIICLNYIFENNLIDEDWHIYNLNNL